MKSLNRSLGQFLGLISLALIGSAAFAGELYVNTFLGTNPLQDLEVELDGRELGATDKSGAVVTELSEGKHVIRILEQNVQLTSYSFELAPGESADLSITFTDFAQQPEVSFDKYNPEQIEAGSSGVVSGQITDADGAPLSGATILLEPMGIDKLRVQEAPEAVVTDDQGQFSVDAPRGRYSLNVAHEGFESAQADNVRIVANVGIVMNVALQPLNAVQEIGGASSGTDDVVEMAEIVVVGTYQPRAKTVDVERFSVAVTDAISVEELLRAGDSDVAASLKRVVGIAITGGKYAVVRGLDGRYISATLNGDLMPSTDPFRRDVQLDLFPSDILGGIEIQKSFSADLPGDTTGGIIKIKTRDIPKEYVNSLSVSGAYITGVTGEDLATYEGSDTDVFGYDDGLRDLPGAVYNATNGGRSFRVCQTDTQTNCAPPPVAVDLAESLPNIYNPKTESSGPNLGLAYSLGNRFDVGMGDLGLYGTLTYDHGYKSRQDAFTDGPQKRSTYVRDTEETAVNGYFVAGLESNAGWDVFSKTILLRNSESVTEIESGEATQDEQIFSEVLLEWVEREYLGQQLSGKNHFFDDNELEWRAGISRTSRQSPDRRSYEYRGSSDPTANPNMDTRLVPTGLERSYSDLTEDGLDLGLDYLLPVDLTDDIESKFKFGFLYNNRDRDYELVRIGFDYDTASDLDLRQDVESLLIPENFESGAFTLAARTTPTDAYEAEQESVAYYAQAETNIGFAWTAVIGVRQDDFSQKLSFPNSTANSVDVDSNELLPAAALIYRPSDHWQFRGGYSLTVSRPNVTENAPTRFFDERGREYIGCTASGAPACIASKIDNYDLRAEYYFDNDDSISLALFAKDISDPIERAISDGSGSATQALTFRNNESAKVSGIEFDTNLTVLDLGDHVVRFGGNVSFIQSEITLTQRSRELEAEGADGRDLQGQSPMLANMQIGYDHFPTNQRLTFLVNYFDDRIDVVARRPQSPIYEKGRATLNLTYEKEFENKSKLGFKIKNLLDEKVQYEQDGKIVESYKEGTEFSLGYTYKF
jgi:TonB-dependent receptor